MLLAVGLGNPGGEHAGHRHNIGFMAVDAIARRHGFGAFRGKFRGRIADGAVAGEKVLLLKPETFMNLSGDSVGEAARFHKIAPADVLVIHDELDLAPGRLRVKVGGGHGGHNGLRSIDRHLGVAYRRLRLGIGHPGDRERVHGHVLSDFSRTERTGWLETLLDAVAEHFPLLVAGRNDLFMNRAPRPPGAADGDAGTVRSADG